MLPLLTRAQMVALDRLTIDEIGIKAPVLMEVAGRHVANEVEVFAQDDESPILALAGTGHNGADAVVAARHLAERGYSVDVAVIGLQEKLTEDAAAQVAIAQRLGVNVGFFSPEDVEAALEDLILSAGTVIDGLFGTGLSRPLEGGYQKVVDLVASRDDLRVVAV
ncbi:MAG: NAD(P)H-hydrate epimerase, partial [Myxococcota bacterium]